MFRAHVQTRLGDIKIRDFRAVTGQRLLAQIFAEDKVGHLTMAHIKSFLSGVFTFALREGVLDGVNPMRPVQIPGRPARTTQPRYQLGEIDALLRSLPEPARSVIAVAAFTGLRISEVQGLQWNDFDGENNLHVRRSIWRTTVGATKTVESEASVPVLPFLQKVLEAHRARSKRSQPLDYIFAGERRGAPLNMSNLARRVIRPAIANITLDDEVPLQWKGFHAFRRGLASNLFAAGVPGKTIQGILRHSQLSTTMEIYVQSDEPAAREAMQKIEDVLFPFGGQ